MDKNAGGVMRSAEAVQNDRDFALNATAAEKFAAITYLRECFYGTEATTGRVQRVYQIFKRK